MYSGHRDIHGGVGKSDGQEDKPHSSQTKSLHETKRIQDIEVYMEVWKSLMDKNTSLIPVKDPPQEKFDQLLMGLESRGCTLGVCVCVCVCMCVCAIWWRGDGL